MATKRYQITWEPENKKKSSSSDIAALVKSTNESVAKRTKTPTVTKSTLPTPKVGTINRNSGAKVLLPNTPLYKQEMFNSGVKLPTIKGALKALENSAPNKIMQRAADTFISNLDKAAGVDPSSHASFKPDTNAVESVIGDIGGTVASIGGRLPGTGASMQSAFTPAGNAASRLVTKGLTKVSPNLPSTASKVADYVIPTLAKEGTEGALYGAAISGASGDNMEDSFKTVGRNALENAIGGFALKGAGDVFSHSLGKIGKVKVTGETNGKVDYVKEDGSTGTMSKVIFDKEATPIVASPKYTVKNTALDNAQQEYDNAIQTINNHFGTNKLTPEETASIKPNLGIDLDQLVKNMETAKTTASGVGNRVNMARVAGVDSTSFKPVNKSVTEQIPYYRVKRTPVKEELPTMVTYRGKTAPTTKEVEVTEQIPSIITKREKVSGSNVRENGFAYSKDGRMLSGDSNITDRIPAIAKNYEKPTNKEKLKNDLLAVSNKEVDADEVSKNLIAANPRAKVHGYDHQQRTQIADELVKGLKSEKETIHIDVVNDGQMDIANDPHAVSTVLDALRVKNERNFNAKPLPTIETKSTDIFKGNKEIKHTATVDVPSKRYDETILAGVETNTLKKKDMSGGYKTIEHTETVAEPFTTDKASVKLPTLKKLTKPTVKTSTEPITDTLSNSKANIPQSANKPLNEPVSSENADMSHPAMGATNRTESMQDVSMGERPDDRTIKQKIVDKGKHLYKIGVDVFNTGKDFDETTYIKMINSKKVGGTVTNIYEKDLVDMQGNVMGESLKSIAKDLPADLDTRKKFMKYVLMKHNIDRAREGKNVFTDFDSEGSSKAVAVLEKNNPEWKALNDRLVGFTNKFMGEWGNNSGLISDDLWDELNIMYKNYVPTQREFSALEKGVQRVGSGGGKGFVDTGNTLKKAQGSDRDIKDPMENIMNLVNKVTRTARYNEVGQSMLAKLKSDPEGMKKYAEIIPDGDDIDPNVENIVTVIDKGQPVYVKVNDIPFLESLKGVYKDIELDDFENLVAKFGQGFKNLITTDNPFFAIFNGARDIPTAYIFGSEGNPAKFAKDYISAMVDIVRGGEGIRKYKAVGGEMGNYFAADETAKAVEGLTKEKNLGQKALQGIRGFNNAIEDAPRLAEFNRALKNGDDVQTALYKAGEVTTNFSRGGSNVRKLDKKGVPYLNASVQGIDRFARAMKNDTGKTITRSAVAITLPTVALNLINWDNDNYKALDNRTKDTYYCIPNIADGGETFIKLPKSRETGVIFGALTERIIRQLRGEDNAFKDMGGYKGTVANNFLPVNPLNSNLAMPLINAYATNTDFAGRKIVPQGMKEGASLINQYDETTSEIGKLAAQLTQHAGLGPKQVDYLLKSYTGVIAQFVLPAATKNSYKNDNGTAAITKPIKTKFVADPAYSNQAITDFYDNFDTLNRIAGDYNLENDIPSKDITVQESYKNRFAKISKQMTELSKAAKNATSPEEAREYRKQMIELAEEANSILPTQSKSKLKKEFESGRLPMLNNKSTSKK